LGDVVDPALDHQHIGAAGTVGEPLRDLIGALAEDAAVAKTQPRVRQPGPVLVLAALVGAEAGSSPRDGVGVIAGVAGGDRIAERRDDDLRPAARGREALAGSLALAVAATAAGGQQRGE
jgi:hypothetical protein